METRISLAIITCLSLAMVGCGNYAWQHSTKPANAIYADKLTCKERAERTYPPMMVELKPEPDLSPASTSDCTPSGNGNFSCTTWAAPRIAPARQYRDTNSEKRSSFFDDCLASLGWHFGKVEEPTFNPPEGRSTVSREPTPPQRSPDAAQEALNKLTEQSRTICINPSYTLVFLKTPCNASRITSAQLSDTSRLDAKIQPVFLSFHRDTVGVLKERVAILRSSGVGRAYSLAGVNNRFRQRIEQYTDEFVAGKTTWGEFNRARAEASNAYDSEILKLSN